MLLEWICKAIPYYFELAYIKKSAKLKFFMALSFLLYISSMCCTLSRSIFWSNFGCLEILTGSGMQFHKIHAMLSRLKYAIVFRLAALAVMLTLCSNVMLELSNLVKQLRNPSCGNEHCHLQHMRNVDPLPMLGAVCFVCFVQCS